MYNGNVWEKKTDGIDESNWYKLTCVENLGRKRSGYGIRYSREWLAYGNGNGHGIAGTLNTGG